MSVFGDAANPSPNHLPHTNIYDNIAIDPSPKMSGSSTARAPQRTHNIVTKRKAMPAVKLREAPTHTPASLERYTKDMFVTRVLRCSLATNAIFRLVSQINFTADLDVLCATISHSHKVKEDDVTLHAPIPQTPTVTIPEGFRRGLVHNDPAAMQQYLRDLEKYQIYFPTELNILCNKFCWFAKITRGAKPLAQPYQGNMFLRGVEEKYPIKGDGKEGRKAPKPLDPAALARTREYIAKTKGRTREQAQAEAALLENTGHGNAASAPTPSSVPATLGIEITPAQREILRAMLNPPDPHRPTPSSDAAGQSASITENVTTAAVEQRSRPLKRSFVEEEDTAEVADVKKANAVKSHHDREIKRREQASSMESEKLKETTNSPPTPPPTPSYVPATLGIEMTPAQREILRAMLNPPDAHRPTASSDAAGHSTSITENVITPAVNPPDPHRPTASSDAAGHSTSITENVITPAVNPPDPHRPTASSDAAGHSTSITENVITPAVEQASSMESEKLKETTNSPPTPPPTPSYVPATLGIEMTPAQREILRAMLNHPDRPIRNCPVTPTQVKTLPSMMNARNMRKRTATDAGIGRDEQRHPALKRRKISATFYTRV
ncbi:hypothetical protein FN846DRAFT_993598 [Sphaerosporella brunnea]|uniref:Uncharacterized protein n=1 Tax=Sphaerosporella brunnea TaxID=1250544 RepID=A0A5J5EN16_9PEZI|nr:hypothetical protein FN846DRAFT_993598 [Sphaerosporella brunnea]